MIDLATLQRDLISAEARAAQRHRNVERQRRLVVDLERDGRDTSQAKQLLASLEKTQVLNLSKLAMIADRLEKLP